MVGGSGYDAGGGRLAAVRVGGDRQFPPMHASSQELWTGIPFLELRFKHVSRLNVKLEIAQEMPQITFGSVCDRIRSPAVGHPR